MSWENLLRWLEEKGMDTSDKALLVERRRTQGAGYGLFAIKTLQPIYDRASLTAVQLISMHLALHRDKPDPTFGPYLTVLPRDFAFHPLFWIVESNASNTKLVSLLPASVLKALYVLHRRFIGDLAAVVRYMEASLQMIELVSTFQSNYLWAWLIVNTRSIYLRMKPNQSHPDNLTLCPILDMANHSSHLPHMTPRPPSTPPRAMSFLAPKDASLAVGDEIFLNYGAHSNCVLFVEYGFVQSVTELAIKQGLINAESDVSQILEDLFVSQSTLKMELENVGYWGDWTLHATKDTAYPSFRVIAALRLYHLMRNSAAGDRLYLWKDTISGLRDHVSAENEEATRTTLCQICAQLEETGQRGIQTVQEWQRAGVDDGTRAVCKTIMDLWFEDVLVARSVHSSILNGDCF